MRAVWFGIRGERGRILLLMVFAAVFLFLAGILSACGAENELPDFTPLLSDDGEGDENSQGEAEEAFAQSIRIVLPADRSVTLYERAQMLGDAIAERTEIPYVIVTDQNLSASRADAYELVIGESEHPDCALKMRGLKKEDYVCAVGRYATVIGGRSEAATLLALDAFEQRLLPSVSRAAFVPQGVQILEKTEYERDFVSWNGEELSNFCIVYDAKGATFLRTLAEHLRDEIERVSGYVVPAVSENEVPSAKRMIRFSAEAEPEGTVRLCPTEEGISLRAETGVGLKTASDAFLDLLFLDEDGDGSCENRLDHAELLLAERSEFRLGCAISSFSEEPMSPEEVAAVTDWIQVGERDGVFLSEVSESNAQRILQNLYGWQWISEEGAGGTVTFLTVTEEQSILADGIESEGILGAYRIGGERGGFLWLTVKEGTKLPLWVYEVEMPLLVTVYGGQDGRLAQDSVDGLDCLYNEETDVGGETLYFSVYATASRFSVALDAPAEGSAGFNLRVIRLY